MMKKRKKKAGGKNVKSNTAMKRTYKDSVFRMLFNDKEKLIELYNALFGTTYGPETPLDFTTIEEVLFKTMKNDITFTIDGTFIVLIEHQRLLRSLLQSRCSFRCPFCQPCIAWGKKAVYIEREFGYPRFDLFCHHDTEDGFQQGFLQGSRHQDSKTSIHCAV